MDSHSPTRAERPSDRSFGIVMMVVFGFLGVWPMVAGGPARAWSLGIAVCLGLLAWLAPRWLGPLNSAWMRMGDGVGRIVSPLALGVLFFGFVTPYGWLMRRLGKSTMMVGADPQAASYWIERRPPGPEPQSLRAPY